MDTTPKSNVKNDERHDVATTGERLSHLEGGYEHLATKVDVQALGTRMVKQIAESETRVVKWMVGAIIGGIVAGAAMITVAINLVG